MTNKLMPDTPAPALRAPLVGGGNWDLAEQRPQNFTMVVFYRGYHCPVCKGYLGRLEELMGSFRDAGFSVLAVSMDGEERAAKTKQEWGLAATPVGYGLSEATARAWGLWISAAMKEAEISRFNEPGLFWIRPDGRLYLMDISNMPFARPDLDALLGKVNMVVENGYPARGAQAAA